MAAKQGIVVASAVAAIAVIVVLGVLLARHPGGEEPLPEAATQLRKPPVSPKRIHRDNWAIFRGDAAAKRAELVNFDFLVAPGIDGDTAKWLTGQGVKVVAEEPKFGGVLPSGKGEDVLAKVPGAVCWLGFDYAQAMSPDQGKAMVALCQELAAWRDAHEGEKVLVFAPGLGPREWTVFKALMQRFRFVPYSGPADCKSLYDFVLKSASDAPREAKGN